MNLDLTALYERTVSRMLGCVLLGGMADERAFRDALGGAMVEAAEIGTRDPEPPTSVVRHVREAESGRVRVQLTRSTTGVSLEVVADRPREPGESWDEAAAEAARIAAHAYARSRDEAANTLGLTIGPTPKPDSTKETTR